MPLPVTSRHQLPLLEVSQAQKEITHNEALVRIDALLHPVVQSEIATPPLPTDADFGKCWLVADGASGVWSGKAGQLAIWIGGGWRYCAPVDGMRIRFASSNIERIRANGAWLSNPTVPDPSGGATIDAEARSALSALLAYLRASGQIDV